MLNDKKKSIVITEESIEELKKGVLYYQSLYEEKKRLGLLKPESDKNKHTTALKLFYSGFRNYCYAIYHFFMIIVHGILALYHYSVATFLFIIVWTLEKIDLIFSKKQN